MKNKPKTWLHQLHPSVQLVWLLTWALTALLCHSIWGSLGLLFMLNLLMWQAGHPLSKMKGCWTYPLFAFTIILVHALLEAEGPKLLGPFTSTGLSRGVIVAARLLSLIIAGRLFALTTDPSDLAQVLIRWGLPYRWAYAMLSALRLEPLLSEQARTIYWAQLTRGVQYQRGPLIKRWFAFRRLLVPLLISVLRSAREMAAIMENRAFGLHKQRTCLRPPQFRTRDIFALVIGVTISMLCLL